MMPPFKLIENGDEYTGQGGLYYWGFVHKRDGEFHPWMGGEMRRKSDEVVIAQGDTPESLELAVYNYFNPSVSEDIPSQIYPGPIPYELKGEDQHLFADQHGILFGWNPKA